MKRVINTGNLKREYVLVDNNQIIYRGFKTKRQAKNSYPHKFHGVKVMTIKQAMKFIASCLQPSQPQPHI